QLREVTGIQDPHILYRALKVRTRTLMQLYNYTLSILPGTFCNSYKGLGKDELQAAIELSLQESQKAQEEEKEFHRAEENAARMKRRRCEGQSDMSSPADWIRQDDWPVGIRNVGNTCWFSAVIQSLFHLPVFKRLVLNYHLSERLLEKCKTNSRNIAFMQELRCLFALMVGSTRRFVDPSAAVELLRDAFRTSEAQQDVSEFTHKLLDWLEDAFQLAANGNDEKDKSKNPMVQLFYGTFVTERVHEGKTLCNIEQFGQYPLQVNGFNNLDECLEGAMVEREIESLHSDHCVTSGRERWFKKLPPVLTFELSRFEFNTQLGRPEKIHKKLEFPQIIYMDRYLHKNIQLTHERRSTVKKLKEQLAALQQKFECYKNYGSGPTKYPLTDMLQFVLEFATTKPSNVSPTEDLRAAASSPTPLTAPSPHPLSDSPEDASDSLAAGVSTCQRTPIYKPFTQCRPPVECPPHPAPHSITEEELYQVKNCLQRWRTEAENDINELKASIDRVSQELESMYSDNSLCQVPYRLHAVLVHEGQASAGHYWAYIYDHAHQRWIKYNDITVSESSWEELERDSFGGMTNASAYCLMYIDDRMPQLITEDTDDETGQVLVGMDSLPPVLRRYVHEDNRWFQQELSEWEEQFCQASAAAPQEESTVSAEPPEHRAEELHQKSQEPGSTESTESTEGQDTDTQAQEDVLEQMMLTPAMQGIILAIAKARKIFDQDGPEAGLIKAFHEEYNRLYDLSQEEATPAEDARLHHCLVYFFQNKAPKRIIERTLLEQFTDRNLTLAITQTRVNEIKHNPRYQWHEDYKMFKTVFVYLLTGLEHYQNGKMREALTYLAHAYDTNSTLLKNGPKRGVDDSLISVYRRKCLMTLNESASRWFCCGEEDKVTEALALMDECVIPCLHLMSRDPALTQEDRDTLESIRSHWCCCLSQDMNESLQVKLGEFLPRVLDCSAETVVLKDPPKIQVHAAHDLCSRLAALMESIHSTSVVRVK
uniref:Ubiquitin carboxyl-terminal hydrolase n=1 Tax=Periophthalmus magnuspinnatus TaxID=409849 RepID=A0A3B3ZZL2_9GOBI